MDRVCAAQSMGSFGASSTEQFFVSISRARESVTIYTDDKILLAEAIQSSSARMSAHELIKLPAAAKILDPFESILREWVVFPVPEKMNQTSQSEKDIAKKRQMESRRARQWPDPVHQAQMAHQHTRGISL